MFWHPLPHGPQSRRRDQPASQKHQGLARTDKELQRESHGGGGRQDLASASICLLQGCDGPSPSPKRPPSSRDLLFCFDDSHGGVNRVLLGSSAGCRFHTDEKPTPPSAHAPSAHYHGSGRPLSFEVLEPIQPHLAGRLTPPPWALLPCSCMRRSGHRLQSQIARGKIIWRSPRELGWSAGQAD